jgi:hypothetical protein
LSSKRSITKNLAICFQHHFTLPRMEFHGGDLPGERKN